MITFNISSLWHQLIDSIDKGGTWFTTLIQGYQPYSMCNYSYDSHSIGMKVVQRYYALYHMTRV